ncbi:MAG: ferrous iron transport protein B [Deltaproteobacteria bacterium]|nr:ferrous iron transport protein B [Deltaproteobacteria bacterium]
MVIAFIGQPNCGKSTIFNYFSGYKAVVSNFPGTTVKFTESRVVVEGREVTCVDLPGVYSLTSADQAELEARNYLLKGESADVIVNVMDASLLSRSLELTLELMSLERPLVVALNMMDEADRKGVHIDTQMLSALLGVPVVPTIAATGRGLTELLKTAVETARHQVRPATVAFSRDVEEEMDELSQRLELSLARDLGLPWRFFLIKLLEDDPHLLAEVELRSEAAIPLVRNHQKILAQSHGRPPEIVIASERHALSVNLFEQVAKVTPREKPRWRDRLDWVATHKFWGYVLLILVLGLFFQVVFRLGQHAEDYLMSYLEHLQNLAQGWLGAESLAYFLVGDGLLLGIFGGVGIVLPYLLPFLLGLALLEDSGYLPRVAFLMDNFMHLLGLHGKSIIPFILGYGCSVPAVMASRILESPRDRLVVALLSTLIPCSARSVLIFALVAYALGPYWALGVYLFNLLVIAVLGRLSTWLLSEVSPGLLMEIPEYRMPTWTNVWQKSWRSLKDFIVVAWPILIAGSLVLSLLKYWGLDRNVNNFLAPLTSLLDLPAAVGTTLIFGIMRKELSLVMLNEALGTTQLHTVLTPAQLLTFTVFVLFYIPCASTVAALSREVGWKGAFLSIFASLALALSLGMLTRALGMAIL